MSVSPPFRLPSVQLGSRQMPLTQVRETQSVPTLHFMVLAHSPQTSPPQSTSVSGAVWTLSLQLGRQLGPGQVAAVVLLQSAE
jgi:hypothetical protein